MRAQSTHSKAVRGLDLYPTPVIALEKLLGRVSLPQAIWEPACGPGALVSFLRAAGHDVYASDIFRYHDTAQDAVCDFFDYRMAPHGYATILTNPPYMYAQRFVTHGLTLVPEVILLLRLSFLESERRRPLFDRGRLRRVLVFSKRLPMMHRDGYDGKKSTSNVPFAWFVFDRQDGPTTVEWL